jgi:hypothetical protein
VADDLGGDYFGDLLGAGGERRVLAAEGDADLAAMELGGWVGGVVALVVVNGPGEGGDGHDQAGQRDRVEVPVRALPGVAGGQGGLDLRRQVRAEVGGQDRGGGTGPRLRLGRS